MILFSPGIKRRVAAGLCAVALMAALVAFPLRARAMAPALPAIGYATTIAAFLAACGIYPFQTETGESFGEWGARQLTELWDIYVTEVYPTSEAAQAINDVKSFYTSGGYMVMAADTWSRLRSFAGWIVSRFSVQSGRTDLELGESSLSGFAAFPAVVDFPLSTGAEIVSNGIKVGYSVLNSVDVYYAVYGSSEVYFCYYLEHYYRPSGPHLDGDYYFPLVLSKAAFPFQKAYSSLKFAPPEYEADSPSYNGDIYWSTRGYPIKTSTLISGVPLYASRSAALAAFAGVTPTLAGITADTGATIAIPDALPEGAEFGGLQVAGLGAGATAQALEDVIEGGVMERQQPVVRPVEVEIGAGTDVDTETGEVTGNAIVITPDSVVLSSSDFTLPRAISTVFPFSVPWDIMRVYQALDAEPAFPEIHAYLYVPGSSFVNPDYVDDKIPFIIGIPEDMKPGFDAFAEKFRSIALLLACIATTWAMVKFVRY